jgi:hypothetical protein
VVSGSRKEVSLLPGHGIVVVDQICPFREFFGAHHLCGWVLLEGFVAKGRKDIIASASRKIGVDVAVCGEIRS